LLLPALAKAKTKAQGIQCMGNLKQLQTAAIMYADDNGNVLMPTVGEGPWQVTSPLDPYCQPGSPGNQWIYGDMTQPACAANADLLKAGLIFPYAPNIALFKCPADPRTIWFANIPVPPGGNNLPTVRSMSMNAYLNPITWNPGAPITYTPIPPAPNNGSYKLFRKMTDISVMGQVNCWMMLDENPYSINDGWFCTDPTKGWVDKPATYHNNAGGLSFADGHALIRKWTDMNLINYRGPVPSPGQNAPPLSADPNPKVGDVVWLMQGASILR
jgi:hypothetical protein